MKLYEIIDIKRPKEIKSGISKKAGLQGAVISQKTRTFTTSKNNKVTVVFEPTGDKDYPYEVLFYVNGTMFDRVERDSEILPGVLYIVKTYIERKKINGIRFRAIKSDGDTKTVKGLDVEAYKNDLFGELSKLSEYLKNTPKKEIQPTQSKINLFKKLGRDITPTYNIPHHEDLTELLDKVINGSGRVSEITSMVPSIVSKSHEIKGTSHSADIERVYNAYLDSVRSNDESGLTVSRNRRKSLYKKILDRFFPEWDNEESYDTFYIRRKGNQE